MMSNDDLGERRQVNHTPTIALGLAAVLLLIVGFLSYKDFLETRFEKEYAEKERLLLMRHGYPVDGMAGTPNLPDGQAGGRAEAVASSSAQNQVPTAPPVAAAPQVDPASSQDALRLAQNASQRQVEQSLPQPNDPEIESIRSSLDQARQQSELTQQQYREITGNVDSLARSAAEESAEITAELPDFLREAMENPVGGDLSEDDQLDRMREQIQRAPALAKVTGYDSEWGIVTFNAGQNNRVEEGSRFAVRRGNEIVGWIKVDEVRPDQSIAILVTGNRDIDTAKKPEVGDELIDFELY